MNLSPLQQNLLHWDARSQQGGDGREMKAAEGQFTTIRLENTEVDFMHDTVWKKKTALMILNKELSKVC